MKYVKILGLLAVAAAALMAFAGSASATTLTSPEGTALGNGTVITSEGEAPHTKLDGTVTLTCENSTVSGKITDAHGATGVVGTIETLTFTNCGSNTVTTVANVVKTEGGVEHKHYGTLRINSSKEVFSTGAEVTAVTHNILGTVHCIYKTNNTKVGTLTTSNETVKEIHNPGKPKEEKTLGGTATLDIGSAGIPEVATDTFACKDDAVWTGNYKVTSPDTLYVD